MEDFFRRLVSVHDAAEETFELFAALRQDGADLGMLAPTEKTLDLSFGKLDLTITQSPGLLNSDNSQGTTGAAVWQTGIRVGRWLSTPDCPLLQDDILPKDAKVLELGCGISGIVSILLATKIIGTGQVIASDMAYTMRGLRHNIEEHQALLKSRYNRKQCTTSITTIELDWETDVASSRLQNLGLPEGVDLIVACDCVYNYALLQPFLNTCKNICDMRGDPQHNLPTSCLIIQQLRQPEVLEEWLEYALTHFSLWRLPNDIAGQDLAPEQGFVAYILRTK